MNNKMKKIFIVTVLTAVFSAGVFADIVIAPNLGYAHNYWWLTEESRVHGVAAYKIDTTTSVSAFTFGVDMMFSNKKNGFSFFFNNQFSFPGRFYTKENIINGTGSTKTEKKTKGYIKRKNTVLWDTALLLGHRFKINKAILSMGVGLGLGIGGGNREKDIAFSLNVGTTMHFSLDYLFTKRHGLHIAASDTVGRELSNAFVPKNSWINRFQFKMGPTFNF